MREFKTIEHHRSVARIRNLGEVFTPEIYVEEMLDLLSKSKHRIWSDENVSFFEPCAGHGNIVTSIYKRRLEGINQNAISQGKTDSVYYAVANAINTLWAIDIDSQNVESCRSRILLATLNFLKTKLEITTTEELFAQNKTFFAHLLAAIKWHIEVNETLSALSDSDSAQINAGLTKSGGKWFAHNGHHQIDFGLTWVKFFEECEASKTVPLEFKRAMKIVEFTVDGKASRGFDDYDFAKVVINSRKSAIIPTKKRSVLVEA